jgi:hypothetical protein
VDERLKKTTAAGEFWPRNDDDALDLNALLHPAQAFAHPSDVVNDPDLTLTEKRAILASWASDACAVESAPALRCAPDGGRPVGFDDVMDALRSLDKQDATDGQRYGRVAGRRRIFWCDRDRGRGESGSGQPLQ